MGCRDNAMICLLCLLLALLLQGWLAGALRPTLATPRQGCTHSVEQLVTAGRLNVKRSRAGPLGCLATRITMRVEDGADSDKGSGIADVAAQIKEVAAQIKEVAVSIKLVQTKIDDVGNKIECTKAALGKEGLSPDQREILVMELKSLINKEAKLLDEKKSLMDEKKSLMKKEESLVRKEESLVRKEESLRDEKKSLMSTQPLSRVEGFSAVWTALVNDEIIEDSTNPRLWSLPAGVEWVSGLQMLYNRPCYDKMTADISPLKLALVVGTPGIGKTMYLKIFLAHLARKARREGREPPSIHYLYKSNERVLRLSFLPDGTVVDISGFTGAPDPEYELSDSVDLDNPRGKTLSLLVASDKEANYNNFFKRLGEGKEGSGKSIVMPLFSFEELRILRPELDSQKALFRYNIYGGSARNFIFANVAVSSTVLPVVDDVMSFIFQNFKVSNLAAWEAVARHVSYLLQRKEDNGSPTVNSMMWHMQADGSKNWASKFMQMLAGEVCEARELAITTSLEQMVGRSGIENAFECMGHRKLVTSALPFLLKPLLENMPNDKPDFESATFSSLPVVEFNTVDEISILPNSTYGLPMTPNFPVSDAVLQPDTLLQFTISPTKHKGSLANLELQRAKLNEKDRSKHRLVFVIPKKSLETFKYQEGLGDIRQFVCLSEPSAVKEVTLMSKAEKKKWIL